jgi:hypothetical protein
LIGTDAVIQATALPDVNNNMDSTTRPLLPERPLTPPDMAILFNGGRDGNIPKHFLDESRLYNVMVLLPLSADARE